jgi:hypothetical protein
MSLYITRYRLIRIEPLLTGVKAGVPNPAIISQIESFDESESIIPLFYHQTLLILCRIDLFELEL